MLKQTKKRWVFYFVYGCGTRLPLVDWGKMNSDMLDQISEVTASRHKNNDNVQSRNWTVCYVNCGAAYHCLVWAHVHPSCIEPCRVDYREDVTWIVGYATSIPLGLHRRCHLYGGLHWTELLLGQVLESDCIAVHCMLCDKRWLHIRLNGCVIVFSDWPSCRLPWSGSLKDITSFELVQLVLSILSIPGNFPLIYVEINSHRCRVPLIDLVLYKSITIPRIDPVVSLYSWTVTYFVLDKFRDVLCFSNVCLSWPLSLGVACVA